MSIANIYVYSQIRKVFDNYYDLYADFHKKPNKVLEGFYHKFPSILH